MPVSGPVLFMKPFQIFNSSFYSTPTTHPVTFFGIKVDMVEVVGRASADEQLRLTACMDGLHIQFVRQF
jgi:hypothetical protein